MKKFRSRYEIKSKIGEGGMGVVFRAYDPPPMDRDVAIKTLPELADRMALDLFYKECNTLKSISHPNIVEIFDMGEFDDAGKKKPFFVMPLLQGQTLDEIIKNAPHRLTVDRVVDIISQTCRGLQAAHEHGLVHRDIKPSNLFVIGDDSVKIIDFGVVHAVDARSRTGSFSKGTLLYMSPEQVANKPLTAQSDIFSLGIVCYEALTRRHPFRGASEEEIVDAIRRLNPPPASAINETVSPLISRVVHKAMAKQPLTRYDSAKEFGDILQRAAHNLPIEIFDPARVQPRIDRAKKAVESGDYQFAGEIISELEAGGNIDPQITELRGDVDRFVRQRTLAQLLENAQTRFEEEEDPLALQKLHDVLQIDPGNVRALGLKSRIEERRSERQVDQWMRLAQQHIGNHSYSHARDALQNVLAIRPKESRALRLAKDLEADEAEYLRLRQEKFELYQSAVNAWKNGDVSEALSHMRLVLDLDGRAPDISTPESSASYQSFYNKIRSEHETLNTGYAEARRRLAEQDFAKALEICEEFLEKYPGQPLFQALKLDVEEQQRQGLSSYIADVNRRLEAEQDLDTKVSLLREALALYPDEPHFQRLHKLNNDKRQLVKSIVLRAETHEERGQINEALSDYETLTSIYPSYPGLKYEIERLEKRRDQQTRVAAKTEWVRRVDRQRETGNYARALEVLEKAEAEFPGDTELVELRKLTESGFSQSQRAEQLLDDAQKLIADGKTDEGTAVLREAHQLDDHHPSIRTTLRDVLVDHAKRIIDSDWQAAESLIDDALELDPQHPGAKSLRSQVFDHRRDDTITQVAARARRLQADKELEKAEAELKRALAVYPGDGRLTVILDTVQKELGLSTRKKARANDLEQLRELRQQAETASDSDELQSVFDRTRQVAGRHDDDATRGEIDSLAHEIQRLVKARGAKTPPAPDRRVVDAGPAAVTRDSRTPEPVKVARERSFGRNHLVGAAIASVLLVAASVGSVAWYRVSKRGTPAATPAAATVPVAATTPAAATVPVVATTPVAATTADAPVGTTAPPASSATAAPVATLDIQKAQPGTQILLDESATPLGTVGDAGTFQHAVPPGSHAIRLSLDGYQTKRVQKEFASGATVSLTPAELELARVAATLDVVADESIAVTVSRDRQPIRSFKGGSKLTLPQGTYAVVGRDAAGSTVSEDVTLAAGESKSVALRIVVGGMERFERLGEWQKAGNWFRRKGGGYVVYDNTRPTGRITFTTRPQYGRTLGIRNVQRIRWVVAFADAKNYMLMEMDEKYLYRSEFVDGKKSEMPRVEHGIAWSNPFFNIGIEVTETRLIHQFSLEKEPNWKIFDTWDRRSPGSAHSARTFADGKFGFYLPGNDEIEISNFSFYPSAGR